MEVLVLINMDGGVSEHLIFVSLGSDAHIFLAKRSHLGINIGTFLQQEMLGAPRSQIFEQKLYTHELFTQRHLLKLHGMVTC